MAKRWFVLRVGTNRENKVKKQLWSRIQSNDLQEKISDILVVTERVTEIKNGKRKTVERKVYPGYVMAEIDVQEDGTVPPEVWHLIRETPGQIKFVTTDRPDRPVPLTDDEVEKMLQQKKRLAEEVPDTVNIDLEVGQYVRIREGSFQDFKGTVEELLPEKNMVKVSIMVFGRPTPIDFEFWKVEKFEE